MCYYSAEIALDGKTHQVVLADSNGNGLIDLTFSRPTNASRGNGCEFRHYQGDKLYIRDGAKPHYYDYVALGDHLAIGDALYALKLDQSAGTLDYQLVAGELCVLNVPGDVEYLRLYRDDLAHGVACYQPGDTIRLPAGKYQLLKYLMLRSDEQGDQWRLIASATTETPAVTLAAAKGANLVIGEPFTTKAGIHEWELKTLREHPQKSHLRFEMLVQGAAQERMEDLSRVEGNSTKIKMAKSDSRRPKEGSYKIVTADGESVAQGQFEYG